MSKIKNFLEFLKEELDSPQQPVHVRPIEPVQDQAIQPQSQPTQPIQPVQPQPQVQPSQPTKSDPNKANKKINLTYLDKDSNVDKVKQICETVKSIENQKYIFGVVVRPEFVSECKKYLEDSDIKTITVISFPTGDDKNSIKLRQLQKSISEGADEICVVLDYTKLIEAVESDEEKQIKMLSGIQTDVRSWVEYCKEKSKRISVIIEMEALGQKISKAVEICKKANVDFIMTSTGTYNRNTDYTFEKKMKDIEEIITPEIQAMDDMNINVCGGINSLDRIMKCLSNNKIQKVSTSIMPQELFNKSIPN